MLTKCHDRITHYSTVGKREIHSLHFLVLTSLFNFLFILGPPCFNTGHRYFFHYNDVIMTTMASQITSLIVIYSTVYSDADHRKHQSSASLAFVWGIHRDRGIPRTRGQLRGKCFHLMTLSCFKCQWTSSILPQMKGPKQYDIYLIIVLQMSKLWNTYIGKKH